jgi:hypothetical protein
MAAFSEAGEFAKALAASFLFFDEQAERIRPLISITGIAFKCFIMLSFILFPD